MYIIENIQLKHNFWPILTPPQISKCQQHGQNAASNELEEEHGRIKQPKQILSQKCSLLYFLQQQH